MPRHAALLTDLQEMTAIPLLVAHDIQHGAGTPMPLGGILKPRRDILQPGGILLDFFGHTGFMGTSIWFDLDLSIYLVLLTNRVYPSRDNSGYRSVRPAAADLVFRAIRIGPDHACFQQWE